MAKKTTSPGKPAKSQPARGQDIYTLPYSALVGQEQLKLALELAYVAPKIGGVLISGERGTAKSTAVRAFSRMVHHDLPVTLPINATEDRVVGGWQLDELMRGEATPQAGLLEEADGKLLYVDEINLLDDHIVNIILDVTSQNVLVVQREGRRDEKPVSFTLVGTMNPEEGWLRPQLRDRFGLMVGVKAEADPRVRSQILETVFDFDHAVQQERNGEASPFLTEGRRADEAHAAHLNESRKRVVQVGMPAGIARQCVEVARAFGAAGHRGDYVIAFAARACAALNGEDAVTTQHLRKVAPLALQHRRPEAAQGDRELWSPADDQRLSEVLQSEND